MTTAHNYKVQKLSAVTVVALASVIGTCVTTKLILSYGFGGLLRLIWEGDHLSPDVREAIDALDDLEKRQLSKRKRELKHLRVKIERAKLDSVDGGLENESNDKFLSDKDGHSGSSVNVIMLQFPMLKKDLSLLSHNLDNLVFAIDSVRSHGDSDVKEKKKKTELHPCRDDA